MKTLIMSALLIFSGVLSAQEPFIEIVVSESVMLKPIQIEYAFSSSDYPGFTGVTMVPGYNVDNAESDVNAKMAIGFLEEALKKKKFNYTIRKDEPIIPADTQTHEVIAVTVYSVEELEKLKEVGKSVAGIIGKVENVSHELTPAVKNALFEKIYATALEEAKLLAAVQQMNPGKILMVQETQPSSSSANTVEDYKAQVQIMMRAMFSGESAETDLSKSYTRSFTFRFALIPR